MYFVRVDYIFRGSPVQRQRTIVSSWSMARRVLRNFEGDDFLILQVKIERTC